ncbi:MAG: (Fe-S)-binding protein [Desulfosalsimonadaceae bacterium]
MSDINELVRLLKELDNDLAKCMQCGMCQSVCPLYAETAREADVARGKLVLLQNLSRQILKDPEAVKQRLDKCLLCGSCAAACPSGVPVIKVFLKARAIISGYLGLSPIERILFRKILVRPDRLERLFRWVARFQKGFSVPADETIGSSCARIVSPLIGNRHYVPLSKTPWHKKKPRDSIRADAQGHRILFYPGCLVDNVFPGVADAAMRVFDHHRVRAFTADAPACCGIPALSSGDTKSFEALVRINLDGFHSFDFDFLVTPCATCTATIGTLWPYMTSHFRKSERDRIRVLAEKTMDINQFLVDIVGITPKVAGPGIEKPIVTYHDPCHLNKTLGVFNPPRALIDASGGWKRIEMREPGRCCGMGGSFNLAHYDLSRKIGEKKRSAILETKPDVVATACPACMMQIVDLLSQAGASIPVKHVIELYAEGLGV